MIDELIFEGIKFVSIERAGKMCGYSNDYVKNLCLTGKLECRDVNNITYINERELLRFRQNSAFGGMQYFKDEAPLMPQISKSKKNEDFTIGDQKGAPKPAGVASPGEPKEAVDPELLKDFSVNQFGQKVVALSIAFLSVFGGGYFLHQNSGDIKIAFLNMPNFLYEEFERFSTTYFEDANSFISEVYSGASFLLGTLDSEKNNEEKLPPLTDVVNEPDLNDGVVVENDPSSISPFLTLLGDNPVFIKQGEKYVDPGAIVEDNKDKNLLYTVSPGILDTSVLGEQLVTISAVDSDGNKTEVYRTIIVIDKNTE